MRSNDRFEDATMLYLLRCSENLLGAQRHLLSLVDYFAGRFNKVIVGTNEVPYVGEFEKRGGEWRYLPVEARLDFVRGGYQLAKVISSEKVDIIHSHHRYMTSLAYWLNKFYPVKLVHTAHNVFRDKKLFSFLGHNIIAVSDGVKENLTDYFGIRETEIEVIYNGIAPPEVNKTKLDALKADLGIGEDFTRIACIARLEQAKGHTYLLQAMAKVLREERRIKVLVVGDGSLRNSLQAEADSLGISDNVVFLGFRTDVPEILAYVDFIVLSSLQEGLPLVLLESLSLGTSAVATDVGGVKEIVVDGETGLLLRKGSVEKLAEAILYFARNPEVRRKIGEAGKSYVEHKFSLDSMLRQTEAIYRRVLTN